MYDDVPETDQQEVKRGIEAREKKRLMAFWFERVKDVMLWDHVVSDDFTGEVQVTELRVKETTNGVDPWMVIIKGDSADGTPMIAFHSSGCITDALAGAARRAAKGNLKWRVDEWRVNDQPSR